MSPDCSTNMRSLFAGLIVCLATNISSAQWVKESTGVSSTLNDVAVLDSMKAVAVGRTNTILRTTDAGTTWTYIATPLDITINWNSVAFQDTSHGVIVGDHMIATTANGGLLWKFHAPPRGATCFTSLMLTAANFYVGADSGWVYHTLDTGATWTSDKISQWPIRSMFAWTGAFVLGLPIFALTPQSLSETVIFPSGPWSETILKNFEGLGSEGFRGTFCYGGGPGFIVGVQGDLRAAPAILRRKLMSDTVWTEVAQNIIHDGVLLGISAPSANVIYVCGDGGMLFKSTNGGDTWSSFSNVTTRTLRSVSFFGVNRGFAVGDSGTILYTNNGGGVTGVPGTTDGRPGKFSLEQNYPNPFNPVTHLRFTIGNFPPEADAPSAQRFVQLKVFDVLGREVAVLVNEMTSPGSYDVPWGAGHYSSGVYFYQLRAGTLVQTKKMLLMK